MRRSTIGGLWACERSSLKQAVNPNDRIVLDPEIHNGKPIIRVTRFSITAVAGSLDGGMTFEQVHREYRIAADDVRAALRYVTELLK
jgi:uncharacterized protein (DUF433 family)